MPRDRSHVVSAFDAATPLTGKPLDELRAEIEAARASLHIRPASAFPPSPLAADSQLRSVPPAPSHAWGPVASEAVRIIGRAMLLAATMGLVVIAAGQVIARALGWSA